jgi:hypothetical protein
MNCPGFIHLLLEGIFFSVCSKESAIIVGFQNSDSKHTHRVVLKASAIIPSEACYSAELCALRTSVRAARTMHATRTMRSARTIARPTIFALIGAVHASRHSQHWPRPPPHAHALSTHPPTRARAHNKPPTHPRTHPPTHTTRLCVTGTHARARAHARTD